MTSDVSAPPPSLQELRAGFAEPPARTAPMMRWWWFGPSVERAELDRELTAMATAGIGGVEVAHVYPLAPATASFVDDRHLADLRYAAERARELGLRFDLTLGSGWSFGGPHIDDQRAARCLEWTRREIPPGTAEIDEASGWPGEHVIAAFLGNGSIQEQPDDFASLSVEDGVLRVPDGRGPRQLLIATARPTGQNVKRAAFGAEGPVLDHYSAEATRAHLRSVGDRLLEAVPAEFLGSVFCDSLEVYESDWTAALPAEFEARRGYPLLPVLHLLVVESVVDGSSAGVAGDELSSATVSSETVRADYHRTLLELYEENFLRVIRTWTSERGVPFRIQGYGTPPAAVSSYRFADLIEGEGWGWTKITQTRWASSAAHLYRRPVASAESWTWVHSPSFRATPLDLKGEAHEHLLNGINLLIGHGWPYSPADAPGLGWFFYAAGALDDRNPWWPVMPELTRYLARLCWLMQQGEPVADVALYVPNTDLLAGMGRQQGGSLDLWREASKRIGEQVPAAIRRAGFDYDLIDDEALAEVAADRYPVVVVPCATSVPDETVRWLTEVIDTGGAVITIDSALTLSGAVRTEAADLGRLLASTLIPDLRVTSPAPDIGFVHRSVGSTDIYLVINTGPEPQEIQVEARTATTEVQQWDPSTGLTYSTDPSADGVELRLAPYQATVLVFGDQTGPAAAPQVGQPDMIELDDWTVSFAGESPRAVTVPHVWEDDPDRRDHSGSATYRSRVDLVPVDGRRVILDLGVGDHTDAGLGTEGDMVGPSYRVRYRGPVGEVAQVSVNGTDCGLAWAPPYTLDITDALQSGANEIMITVFNTAANALGADQHIAEVARQSEQRYGRRFRMQELDRAMETVRSGLLERPKLITVRV